MRVYGGVRSLVPLGRDGQAGIYLPSEGKSKRCCLRVITGPILHTKNVWGWPNSHVQLT